MSTKEIHYVILGYKLEKDSSYNGPETKYEGIGPVGSEAITDACYDKVKAGDFGYISSPLSGESHIFAGRVFAKANVYDCQSPENQDLEGLLGTEAKLEVKAWLQAELGLDIPINKIRLYIGTAWR